MQSSLYSKLIEQTSNPSNTPGHKRNRTETQISANGGGPITFMASTDLDGISPLLPVQI